MEQSGNIRFAQGMKSWFDLTMSSIFENKKWLIKKDLFRFSLAHPMLFCIFTGISFIPIKTDEISQINHACILPSYTLAARWPQLNLKTRPLPQPLTYPAAPPLRGG